MRIIIDARSINRGGAGTLLLGVLENLDFTKNEYGLIGDRNELEKLNLPCKIIHNTSRSHSFGSFLNHSLVKVINDYDCFFTPTYIIPVGVKINSYCVFPDTLFFDKRKFSQRRFTDFLKRRVAKRSYRLAKRVFTLSEFSKNRISKIFKNDKKLVVLKPGLCKVFDNVDVIHKETKNYFAFIGSFKRHKNLNSLLLAMEKSGTQNDLHIIVQHKNLRKKDYRRLKQIQKNQKIKILENLTSEEYIREIKNASALIQPSIYEGFAYPLIEAKKLGTPIIASNIESNKEIFSDDEVKYFDPNNIEELTQILKEFEHKDSFEFKKQNEFSNIEVTKKIVSSFELTEKDTHVKRNFVFNVIYQLLVVITPLVTIPYISRILGASNMGQFSFAYTLSFYFIIFGYLGFQQYAQRAIAEVKHDREEQSRVFWQIVIVRLIPVSISLLCLFTLYFLNVFGDYSKLILIFSIIVGSTALDINFFFHGKENFFTVMILNLIIRVVFLVSVFLFVKTRYNLNTYAILYSLMVLGGYLSMWVMLPTNLRKVKLKSLNFKKHMKTSLALFLPVAAISIYAILDKTLIGLLVHGQAYQRIGYITVIANKSDLQNGYYYQAEKIIKALLSVILAYGAVMTTRNTIEYSNNRLGAVKKNVYKSFRFTFAAGVPMALGTIAISKCFVPVFFGQFYDEVAYLLMIYAPVILLTGTSNIIGMQYLLPTKQDKKYSISVLIGFAINLGLNCLLIPFLGARGAIIGTLISEFSIVFIQLLYVTKEIELGIIFKYIWRYLIAGVVMCLACCGIYYFILDIIGVKNLLDLILLIPIGGLIYYLVLLILKEKYIFKYTKLYLIKIGHFFKTATNKTVVQAVSYFVTVNSTNSDHSNRSFQKSTVANIKYDELKKDQEKNENGKRKRK